MTWPRTDQQKRAIALAESVAEPIATRAADTDRANRFPFENFALLRERGYLALTIPERYGGFGADPLAFALASERLAKACGSTALATVMHLALMGRFGEIDLWPEATYARIAAEVIHDGALLNSVNSEPDLGSPSRGALPSTTAVRTAEGWLVNGRKRWASLSTALTYAYSLATIDDGTNAPRRGNLLIPMNIPGVRIEETWDNLGMRGTASNDVVYENVLVGFDALIPAEGSSVPGDGRGWYTFPGAAMYLGIAEAARDEAVNFARTRIPNGMSTPIADLQTVQHRVAEMEILILQARDVLFTTAEEWLAFPDRRSDIEWKLAAAKYTVTNAVLRVTEIAQRVAGSVALADSSPLQRQFRDTRTIIGHPPMEDAILTMVGKHALADTINANTEHTDVGRSLVEIRA